MSMHPLAPISATCPCCGEADTQTKDAEGTVLQDHRWWKFHCDGERKMCLWVRCKMCRAVVSMTSRRHMNHSEDGHRCPLAGRIS